MANNRGQLSRKCSPVFPTEGNRIHLPWWDSNTTINWKFVDDEINPPLPLHQGCFLEYVFVQQRTSCCYLGHNPLRVLGYLAVNRWEEYQPYPLLHKVYHSLQKGWTQNEDGRLMLFLPTYSLQGQNKAALHSTQPTIDCHQIFSRKVQTPWNGVQPSHY